MSAEKPEEPVYLFIDIETTGLDPEKHSIVEAAGIWVDHELKERARKSCFFDGEFQWNPYALEMHRDSGLLEEWAEAQDNNKTYPSVKDFLRLLLNEYKKKFGDGLRTAEQFLPKFWLAGNSVHFDRSFLEPHFPSEFGRKCSHRHLDARPITKAAEMAGADPAAAFDDDVPHRAMGDAERSLERVRNVVTDYRTARTQLREVSDG